MEDNADDLNLIKWACIERQEAFRRERLSKAHSIGSLCLVRSNPDENENSRVILGGKHEFKLFFIKIFNSLLLLYE